MHAILLSAFYSFSTWLLQSVILKAIVFGILFFVVHELTDALLAQIGSLDASALGSSLASLPSGTIWFMQVFRLDVGLPLVLSAHGTAFAIRRLPVIG